MFCQRMFGSPH